MKQHKKRKDLVRRHVMIPKEIDVWINDICAKTNKSRNLVITEILTEMKKMQNFFL